MATVKVVGAGLAGAEAAWQLAERGIAVELYEMKPLRKSPAHHSDTFAELVCSNSFRGDRIENAVGLLKEELRRMGSLILTCADATRVEAGGCLAVDRQGFSDLVTEKIKNHPNITVVSEEITQVPEGPVRGYWRLFRNRISAFFRRCRAAGHSGFRGYGKSLVAIPLRPGDTGLCKLRDEQRGIRSLSERVDLRRGSSGSRI